MKKIYPLLLSVVIGLVQHQSLNAQCGSPVPGGSATNMFTHIRNNTNPVAVDKNLNTVVFIHRQNIANFSGNSGNLRYDISTNAGTTWSTEIGPLNPVSQSYGRYPNAVIYNPAANTNTAAAYIGYFAATINSATSAWNGVVSGAYSFTSSVGTETYNQPAVAPNNVPGSLVKGAPGVFWSVDVLLNASNYATGFTIYKGTWSGTDITWTSNYSASPPFNTAYIGQPFVGDYNIAFDPTGTYGWMSFLGHVTPGPSNYAYYPVFYKTTNGGATWTGPIQVDLNQFSCMSSNLASGNVLSTFFDHDLVVDLNGNPHLLTTVGNGSNVYSVYFATWHHIFDITLSNGNWMAYDLGNVKAGRGTWGTGSNVANMDITPQAARTADGSKLFFGWTDNTGYTLGANNQTPDLFVVGYDVQLQRYTPVKNVSACNAATAGKILFPHFAEEVLQPSTGVFKLAPVYAEFSTAALDPGVATNFKFLDNVTFAAAEFSIAAPPATVSIAQGSTLLACPGSTTNLSLNGNYTSILWSNGFTTNINPVSTAGVYSVLTTGCGTGTAAISITTMSFTSSLSTSSICPGGSLTLNASGNALGYQWMPGGYTGTMVAVYPSSATVYTLTAQGGGQCTSTSTVAVGIYTPPVVSVSGATAACPSVPFSQTASGAATYVWSTGDAGSQPTFTTDINAYYTVTGTDNNGCSSTASVNVMILLAPSINASSTRPVVCEGEITTMAAQGALTYTWNTAEVAPSISHTLSANTDFTVVGANADGCTDTAIVSIQVNPLPSISGSSSRAAICKGETATITLQGGVTYTLNGSPVPPVSYVTPSATITYTAVGTSSLGCKNSTTFVQTVDACTGIASLAASTEGIAVYPNPTSGRSTLLFNGSYNGAVIQVYSSDGRRIAQQLATGETTELSLEAEPAGIYFVTVLQQGSSPVNLKLIRQ